MAGACGPSRFKAEHLVVSVSAVRHQRHALVD
jgi:hypothetical protein